MLFNISDAATWPAAAKDGVGGSFENDPRYDNYSQAWVNTNWGASNITEVAETSSPEHQNNTLMYSVITENLSSFVNFTKEFQQDFQNTTFASSENSSDGNRTFFVDDNLTFLLQNFSNAASEEGTVQMRHPTLAVLFAFFCAFTFASNLLVIVAIIKERYLHSVTNYFIASLAFADCWIGVFVMPLGAVDEMLYNRWIFGRDMCDVWHSCDVLGSTASILNLCVISLDRYWAITDPITYPSKMTQKKAMILIALVWFSALFISFPAIFWWRAVGDENAVNTCIFTKDIGYLAFSSTISFYLPLVIMVFTYYRIYRAANEQTKSLRIGTKQVHAISQTGNDVQVTLRIHRGGGGRSKLGNGLKTSMGHPHSPSKIGYSERAIEQFHGSTEEEDEPSLKSRRHLNHKNLTLSQRLARIAKERVAAQTLGIVMGVFILCWLPFFSTNLIIGACGYKCIYAENILLPLFTWLGWINSCMNPAIYAHRSKEFRRAFIRILCCSRSRRIRSYRQGLRSNAKHKVSRSSKTQFTSISCSKM